MSISYLFEETSLPRHTSCLTSCPVHHLVIRLGHGPTPAIACRGPALRQKRRRSNSLGPYGRDQACLKWFSVLFPIRLAGIFQGRPLSSSPGMGELAAPPVLPDHLLACRPETPGPLDPHGHVTDHRVTLRNQYTYIHVYRDIGVCSHSGSSLLAQAILAQALPSSAHFLGLFRS